jgi:hypothetical protein
MIRRPVEHKARKGSNDCSHIELEPCRNSYPYGPSPKLSLWELEIAAEQAPILLALLPGEDPRILPPARSKSFGSRILLQRIRREQSPEGAQRMDAHLAVAHDARLHHRMVCSQGSVVTRRTFVWTCATKEGKVPVIRSSDFQSAGLAGKQ